MCVSNTPIASLPAGLSGTRRKAGPRPRPKTSPRSSLAPGPSSWKPKCRARPPQSRTLEGVSGGLRRRYRGCIWGVVIDLENAWWQAQAAGMSGACLSILLSISLPPHPHLQPHRPTTTLPWCVAEPFPCCIVCMRPGTSLHPSSFPLRSRAQAANPFTVTPERPSSMTSQASGASGVNIQTGARARKVSDDRRKPSTVILEEFDGLSWDTCFPTCRPPRHRRFPEGPGHGHPPGEWLLQRGVTVAHGPLISIRLLLGVASGQALCQEPNPPRNKVSAPAPL